MTSPPERPESEALPPAAREAGVAGLVLFDGVCGFCDAAVRWLLRHDPQGRLRFAPLQGAAAAHLRARHPEIPEGLETLVYVEARGGEGERVYLRSEAVFRACAQLPEAPRWIGWLARLPRGLTDLGYRALARLRYRLFGRLDACRVPGPGERERMLD
jgi:predicted DCC family thiol-disulfide oxidoreductase YuxK